jgi:hypothetical protein
MNVAFDFAIVISGNMNGCGHNTLINWDLLLRLCPNKSGFSPLAF